MDYNDKLEALEREQSELRQMIGEGITFDVDQQMEVKNPTLWSPDTPYLYRVQSRIKKGNKSIDGEFPYLK